eukprot:770493-Pleurochrysis_carterae.AAC.1
MCIRDSAHTTFQLLLGDGSQQQLPSGVAHPEAAVVKTELLQLLLILAYPRSSSQQIGIVGVGILHAADRCKGCGNKSVYTATCTSALRSLGAGDLAQAQLCDAERSTMKYGCASW